LLSGRRRNGESVEFTKGFPCRQRSAVVGCELPPLAQPSGSPVGYNGVMTEIPAPNYDNAIERLKEVLEKEVRRGKLSTEDAAKLLEETVERWRERVKNWPQIVKQLQDAVSQDAVFAAHLAARQGTHIPDFESFYQERQELDRKIF